LDTLLHQEVTGTTDSTISGETITITGGTLTGSTVTITDSKGGTITVDEKIIYVKTGFKLHLTSGMLPSTTADGTITVVLTSLRPQDVGTINDSDGKKLLSSTSAITIDGVLSFTPSQGIEIGSDGGSMLVNNRKIPLKAGTTFPYPTTAVIEKVDADTIRIHPRNVNIGTGITYNNNAGTFTLDAAEGRTFTVSNAYGEDMDPPEEDYGFLRPQTETVEGSITVKPGGGLLCITVDDVKYYFYVSAETISLRGTFQRSTTGLVQHLDPGQFIGSKDADPLTYQFQNGSADSTATTVGGANNTFTLDITSIYDTVFAGAKITLPTAAIDPQHASVLLATESSNSTTISNGTVTYTGESLTEIGKDSAWFAVLIDGEHVSISGCEKYELDQENGTLTVFGGTSTIGKGALIYDTDLDVDYDTFPAGNTEYTMYVYVNGTLKSVKVTYSKDGTFSFAKVDDILFEPFVLHEDEEIGLNYLFLLGEVPALTHTASGTHLQVASRIYFGNAAHNYVSVSWSIVEGGTYMTAETLSGKTHFVTKALTDATEAERTAKTATREVTLRAQVNVNGKITERYFTFTITYYL
jgi:hypothetical protein